MRRMIANARRLQNNGGGQAAPPQIYPQPGQTIIESKDAKTEKDLVRDQTEQVRAGVVFLYLCASGVGILIVLMIGQRIALAVAGAAMLVAFWLLGYRVTGGNALRPTVVCGLIGFAALETWSQLGWPIPHWKFIAVPWAIGAVIALAAPELLAIYRFSAEVVDQAPRKAIDDPYPQWPWLRWFLYGEEEEQDEQDPKPGEPDLRVVPANHGRAIAVGDGLVNQHDLIEFVRKAPGKEGLGATYRDAWENVWGGTDGYERWRRVVDALTIVGVVKPRRQGKATELAVESTEDAWSLVVESGILSNGRE